MQIRVLGSGAGGGFPQWNCHCPNCRAVRAGQPGFTARTQSSLAVSADGKDWALLNASPDLRQQIAAAPRLSGAREGAKRGSPIKAAVLTNGDVDHVAGLLNLREMEPLTVYGATRVLETLKANSLFNVLAPGIVDRIELPLRRPLAIRGAGVDLGLTVEAFPVPGKVALYLEDASAGPGFGTREGDTLALHVRDAARGTSFFYIPGCASLDAETRERITGAALVFFDGTLYDDEEMIRLGLMPKTGARMGHMSMSGPGGTIAAFAPLAVSRKVFVHINNSNPVLDERSPERRAVEAAGWEIGYDGMELSL
jgi:pyrroloquinoline quinone biosynthesis protein B